MSDRFERTRSRCSCNDKAWATTQEVNEPAVVADNAQEAVERVGRRREEFSNPVCIQTDQIYDACRDRDCVTDQRVYFSCRDQEIVEQSINVKVRDAKIIWVNSDVEPVPFNNGYYAVDIKYFICVTFDAYKGLSCPVEIKGLTTFDKRVILFGSEGNTKTFESTMDSGCNISEMWERNCMPKAVVTVVDPIVLSAKLVDGEEDCCCGCSCGCCCNGGNAGIPNNVCNCFDDELVIDDDVKQVLVSYGLFTIVKMERSVQLLVDAVDFCIPTKECPSSTDQNPCGLFDGIRFPVDEFFPPIKKNTFANGSGGSCGCGACGCGND